MKSKSALWSCLALAILLAGCAEPECRGSSVKYYGEALVSQLSKRGVSYQTAEGVVCVGGFSAAQMRDAQAEVDVVFNELAYLLKDACEERAFAEWAQREALRFDVRPAAATKDGAAGRVFHLRPFTREELAAYRAKLDGAPKDATCKPAARKPAAGKR